MNHYASGHEGVIFSQVKSLLILEMTTTKNKKISGDISQQSFLFDGVIS